MLMLEDRALLRGYREGERPALARVFEHYGPKVSRWVCAGFRYRKGGRMERFEGFRAPYEQHDAISEVFRTVFEEKCRLGYSGLKPFEGYLFAITRNVVLKRLGIKPETSLQDERWETLPDQQPSPEEALAQKEERTLVRRFLDALSEEERALVQARFVDQASQANTAEHLGWTRKKVRIREDRVRNKLIRFLKRVRGTGELREVMSDDAR